MASVDPFYGIVVENSWYIDGRAEASVVHHSHAVVDFLLGYIGGTYLVYWWMCRGVLGEQQWKFLRVSVVQQYQLWLVPHWLATLKNGLSLIGLPHY